MMKKLKKMRFETLNDLKIELVSSSAAYVTSIEGFQQKSVFLKYQDLYEIVSFYFEEFRNEYNQLVAAKISNFNKMDDVVFISWCCMCVFQLLN